MMEVDGIKKVVLLMKSVSRTTDVSKNVALKAKESVKISLLREFVKKMDVGKVILAAVGNDVSMAVVK